MENFISIRTERLILRPIKSSDNLSLFEYRSDKCSNQFQGWIPENLKEVDLFIKNLESKFNQTNSWFQLGIQESDTAQLIGDIGIHFIDSEQVELGITLNIRHQKQGYALEAFQALLHFLFISKDKHRIIGSVDPQNIASIKLLETLGFKKEAHFKQSYWNGKNWVDDLVFALLKSSYITDQESVKQHSTRQ